MSPQFRNKDRRCYILIGYAPKGTTLRKVNLAFNEFIADPRRGLVIFHDHFMGIPGGIALFAIENDEQLSALKERGPLKGWRIRIHPLIYAEDPVGFLYQADFTMTFYRRRRLKDIYTQYESSELGQDNDERAAELGIS